MSESGPVLFYDGECGLCARCVRLLLWADRKRRRLRFAPLQGRAAQAFFADRGVGADQVASVVFVRNWETRNEATVLEKSDALIAAASTAGGVLRVLALLKVVPASWRDAIYAWVARHRRKFFGDCSTDLLPTKADGERFLL
ncbi:MAG: DCC1-like thiol-disulfide oxidoreductase family protein [Nibricoccus sp.]